MRAYKILLLGTLLLVAGCSRNPVNDFKASVPQKEAQLKEHFGSVGVPMKDFTFDVKKTDSEITPYKAAIRFEYSYVLRDKKKESSVNRRILVTARYKYHEGRWICEEIFEGSFEPYRHDEWLHHTQEPSDLKLGKVFQILGEEGAATRIHSSLNTLHPPKE